MRQPRFIAIVTPGEAQRYRVFDRVSKHSYAATDDRELAERLAAEYCSKYAAPWYRRLIAWAFRRQLPQPTPDPVDTPAEPEPEWKRRIRVINELVEVRKRETQLAKGGRLAHYNDLAASSDNNNQRKETLR